MLSSPHVEEFESRKFSQSRTELHQDTGLEELSPVAFYGSSPMQCLCAEFCYHQADGNPCDYETCADFGPEMASRRIVHRSPGESCSLASLDCTETI